MSNAPPPVWRWPAFVGEFADSFVEGTELEGGAVAISFVLLNAMLGRIVDGARDAEKKAGTKIPSLTEDELKIVDDVRAMMSQGEQMATLLTKRVKEAGDLRTLAMAYGKNIEELEEGAMLFMPGGWQDGNGVDTNVMHIVERTGADAFAFVTCNTCEGIEYHPSTARFLPKVKSALLSFLRALCLRAPCLRALSGRKRRG